MYPPNASFVRAAKESPSSKPKPRAQARKEAKPENVEARVAGDSGVTPAQKHGGVRLPFPPILAVPKRKLPTPREGNEYTASVYRPRCLAANRLFKWNAPQTLERERLYVEAYGQEAFDHFKLGLMVKITEKTRENYAAGLLRYAQFCDTLDITEEERFPISQERMAMFVTYQSGKGADAGHFVDGLRMWMLINGVEWARGPLVNAALGAHQNFVPIDARRPPRPPVTPKHLEALREKLDFADPLHSAVFAAACVAFWGVCRLGELVPSGGTFNKDLHVSRDAVVFENIEEAGNGMKTLTFHIPFDKVNKKKGADIVLMNVLGTTSPLHAISWHLKESSPGLPKTAPLFAYADPGSSEGWKMLTKKVFLTTCDAVWRAAGLPAIPYGHSFRIGGTTEYLLEEMDPDRVMMLGRWSSKAFLRYWRKVEKIVPLWSTAHAEVARMTDMFAKAIVAFKSKHRIRED